VLFGLVWLGTSLGRIAHRDQSATPPAARAGDSVVLSPEQLANSGIKSVVAATGQVRETNAAPAHLDYAGLRRVDLKTPTESIVAEVYVKPGDRVEKGQRLALLHSPAIGLLRAELAKERAEARIANDAREFCERLSLNLDKLIAAMKADPEPEPAALSEQFEKVALAQYRHDVLTAYTRYHLTRKVAAATMSIAPGVVSGNVALERKANELAAKGEFLGAVEQARFSATQQSQKAAAAADFSAHVATITEQKLSLLLGGNAELMSAALNSDMLASYYLVAPYAGAVEQREAAPSQRVESGALLFTVADTSTLWAIAEIRDRTWQALSLGPGDTVSIQAPALGNRVLTGVVDHVGRQQSLTTDAVPLVIAVENSEQLMRPGMFVWALLPAGQRPPGVIVPTSCVQGSEKSPFVFLEERPGEYRKQRVVVGQISGDNATITSGLEPNRRVVSEGSFVLKSVLALEQRDKESR